MKKKIATGLVTLLSVVTLAACSSKADDSAKLATMKGDYITKADFYDQVKSTQQGQQAMLTLILDKAFQKEYGDKVSDKKVEEAYNKEVKTYGDSYESVLAMNGMTDATYKQQIRLSLYLEYAVEQIAKSELTDDIYKKLYESYTPEMTLQVIQVADQETANKVLEEVKADGADFAKIAAKQSASDTVDYKADSESTELPSNVIDAASKLDAGAVSDVIPVQNPSTTATTYYIVKTIAKSEKGSDWKKYKDRLQEAYINDKKADSNTQRKVISDVLTKANVKIEDDAFASILSDYISTDKTNTTEATTVADTNTTQATTEAK